MDFSFTSDQDMLRDSIAEFLKKESPFELVKEIQDSDEGYSAKLWKKMARLEWMGVCFPEAYGGFEDPYVSLLIIIEEMGKRMFPSPFVSTIVQCGLMILEYGNEKQKKALLTKMIKGKLIMAMALCEDGHDYQPDTFGTVAEDTGEKLVVNGEKTFVCDANIARTMIVGVRMEEGPSWVLVDTGDEGITVEKMKSLGGDNACLVRFKDVSVPKENIIGTAGRGREMYDRIMPRLALAETAKMLGGCKSAIDMAAAYARERVQYGVPIGAQQSIQHRLADMRIAYDTCMSYFYKVAWMADEGLDVVKDACALKARVSEQFNFISYQAVRIHGGVGLTHEFNVAMFFRYAKAAEFKIGSPAFLYEKTAQELGL